MNTGQMLLTIGAFALLSIIVVNVNRSLTENEDFLNETRFGLESISLATSFIEQASQLPFDEVSWDSTKIEKKISDFTIQQNFGPDMGESSFDTFDDFDDFHNYSISDTTEQNIYNILCQVHYIDPADPNVPINSRSYCKKLDVYISSPMTDDTLSMSYIHGYWYFN